MKSDSGELSLDNQLQSFIRSKAEQLSDYTQAIRRDLHQHPELGLKEFRTSDIVAKELERCGFEVVRGIAKTGVVGLMSGRRPGPTVLVRFDMDALPIQEENTCEYKSTIPGVMHACGHDGHVAIGLATANIMASLMPDMQGTVKFVFQPGEEGMNGAQIMIDEGVLENPKPDLCLSLHVWNERPAGWVAITEGHLMAAADFFTIQIIGRGGHGALPHQTIDPIIAGAQIVSALQSIVSRNIPPLKTAVISATQFLAGDASNVIPQKAIIRGTIRTFEPEIRALVVEKFSSIVNGIASGLGCTVEVEIRKLTMPVYNQPELAKSVLLITKSMYPEIIIENNFRSMVSEDMSFMMDKVPGVYILVGAADPLHGKDFPHHHPRFDFDETALTTGAGMMAGVLSQLLQS